MFEPVINVLPYLKPNLSRKQKGVYIIEAGCGESNSQLNFYMEDLTGQNNSFVQNFKGLETNAKLAPGIKVNISTMPVEVLRLDDFFADQEKPNFIKIDTEGFELSVIKGCSDLLKSSTPPIFMIEVKADQDLIFDIFVKAKYRIFNAYKTEIYNPENMRVNLFAFHRTYHQEKLQRWING